MDALREKRRSFLFALGAVGIGRALPSGTHQTPSDAAQGFVRGSSEGEHLIHFRDHGNIYIKAGVVTGSANLALGLSKSHRVLGFRLTATSVWMNLFTCWKAAGPRR